MCAGAVVGPWCPVQASTHRDRHEFVVRGVVLDLVDAVSVAVVSAQDRLIAVGQLTPALRLGAAGAGAQLGDFVDTPLAAFADQRLDEDG